MKIFFLYINTLRYLKWKQIFYRLFLKVHLPKIKEEIGLFRIYRSKKWHHELLYENKINKRLEATFLNHKKLLNLPADWNEDSSSKLWLYNLHYFEDLLSEGSIDKSDLHLRLLSRWVDENPIGEGIGWEPYPISLRIVNILKSWLGGLRLDEEQLSSVFHQANFLSINLEKHLLGNHYFTNLKALLFAGVIFKNHKWKVLAENGLISEIPEQILEDGANFELSPMYHSLMLVDMLDMFNLCKAYPDNTSKELFNLIKVYIPKMLSFMEAMSHPDGGVSFFNDSVDCIAPSNMKIRDYALSLGFKDKPLNKKRYEIIDNEDSGYLSGIIEGIKIIFDAAPIGPDYMPGHGHADTLCFELSIGPQRVFVNSGISEYGSGKRRVNQRKTLSHNTVEVDHKDSSEVWSGFRVAKRARVLNRSYSFREDKIIFQGTHDGYKSFFRGCLHHRKITLSKDQLIILDSLEGKFVHAKSRLFFHPDLLVKLEQNILKVEGKDFVLISDLSGKKISLINSNWHPEFGVSIPNKGLEVEFEDNNIEIVFTRRI